MVEIRHGSECLLLIYPFYRRRLHVKVDRWDARTKSECNSIRTTAKSRQAQTVSFTNLLLDGRDPFGRHLPLQHPNGVGSLVNATELQNSLARSTSCLHQGIHIQCYDLNQLQHAGEYQHSVQPFQFNPFSSTLEFLLPSKKGARLTNDERLTL